MNNIQTVIVRLGITVLIPVLTAACSLLPGLDLDVSGEEHSAHYQPPGKEGDLVANYSPIVEQITPEVVLEQQRIRRNTPDDTGSAAYDMMREYDATEPYKVGPGDSLGIIVYGQSDLTNPTGTTESPKSTGRLVDATGHIFFPYVGDIKAAGKTTREIRKEIKRKLSEFYKEPQVDVQVVEYRSKLVNIVGDISQPCLIPITELGLSVTEALAQCQTLAPEQIGGAQQILASRSIHLVRDGNEINLDPLERNGAAERFYLKAGDRLVLDSRFNRVFLLGEFQQQQVLPMGAGGLTLTDAIVSGAPSIETIDASQIYVIRGFVNTPDKVGADITANKRPRIYHLDADYASALVLANQFELQPKDVVYAAPASLVNFNRALAQITPLLNTLFQTAVVYDRARNR